MSEIKDLVSVILPCYNQAKYLSESLESVLNQTYSNWECIIVNDGSTDNTEGIIFEWSKKDKRFKYKSNAHQGPSASRNVGLRMATGDYIQFLDADDVIDFKKFEIQINILRETPDYALSICDYLKSTEYDLTEPVPFLYKTPKFKTKNYLNELILDWESELSIPIHCFLFKKGLFKENNIYFNETLPNHVDWECWMKIFRLNPEVKYVDLKLATYRFRTEGRITSNKRLMRTGFLQAINIQKGKFNKHDPEYKLLEMKFNFIRYGTNSNNFALIILRFTFNKIKYLIHKTIYYITKRVKTVFIRYH